MRTAELVADQRHRVLHSAFESPSLPAGNDTSRNLEVMVVYCDVCSIEIPAGTRFCPGCGLEAVDRPKAVIPRRHFDAEAPELEFESGPAEYVVSAENAPKLGRDRLREMLAQANEQFSAGMVREAAGVLRSMKRDAQGDAALRPAFQAIERKVQGRQHDLRENARRLTTHPDGDRLVQLLSGVAANAFEPEQICEMALDAATEWYDARRTDEAQELLRLHCFRTMRDERLVQRRIELEARVNRRELWRDSIRNLTVMGGICVAGAIGLSIWAWIIWQTARGTQSRALRVVLLLGAAFFLMVLPQVRPIVEKNLRAYLDEKPLRERIGEWMGRKRE